MSGRAAREVATGAALLAVACILGLVEASLPALPFAPWLRLGLANIAVVMALMLGGARVAMAVSGGRLLIVGMATGSLAGPSFALAAGGAAASLAVMYVLHRFVRGLTPAGWSAAGSAAHVAAQFAVAAAVFGSVGLFVLAPPSVLLALPLGAIVGSLSSLLVSRLRLG